MNKGRSMMTNDTQETAAESAEAVEATKEQVIAFSETLMSKADMAAHLRDYHSLRYVYLSGGGMSVRADMKATKMQLVAFHQSLHDHPERFHQSHTDQIPHDHLDVSVNPEIAALADAAINGDKRITSKTLSASDRKLLRELIDNDFATTRSQMKSMAANAQQSRLADVDAEFSAKADKQKSFQAKAEKAQARYHDALKSLRVEAEAVGVTLEGGSNAGSAIFKVTVKGHAEARAAVAKNVQDALNSALMQLESQRLAAHRRVLISGVSEEAAKFLDELPDAKQMMAAAAAADHRELESR